MNTLTKPFLRALLCGGAFLCLIQPTLHAGSATWSANPTSGDWNTAVNWTPNTVPDDPSDTATFDASNMTAISQTGVIDVAEIIFNPGASAFTITGGRDFNIDGPGITNNSGVEQNFVAPGKGQSIHFFNSATAGEGTVFTQTGPTSIRITEISFHNTSSAGSATFINEGNGQANSGTLFFNSATAAAATFINKAGVGNGGKTSFINNSTGGNATIICEGGTADSNNISGTAAFWQSSNAENATVILEGSTGAVGAVSPTDLYFDRASAGNATVIANGATTPGSPGSFIEFDRTATADNATLIVNGGTNGGNGGTMFVYAKSTGGTAQLRLFGNGTLDLTYHDPGTFSIGSLAGDGMVLLATNTLRVGTNNLTTEFDGDLVDSAQPPGGSLTKTGSGNLTLTGANAYQGDTIIEGRGILFVNNASGSGTGTGSVQVNSGELAGNGTISGPVVVGNGNPGAARLRPGKSEHNPAVLTIDNTLTFSSDGTYLWLLDTVGAIASSAVANGVTIDSAALFTPLELQSGTLTTGTVFTVITNNGLGAIAGRFSNLADGGTITIGSNTFQANYEGGDGNDLTLTVVQ